MLHPDTPETVEVMASPPEPADDPTLGGRGRAGPQLAGQASTGDHRRLDHPRLPERRHLQHRPVLPAIIAYELGWYEQFRRPSYPGFGGLPLNIEFLLRGL
jgi:hypothetical protein